MPQFRICFRKIVYDDTGHAHSICQRTIDVDARNLGQAQAIAIARFCELERTAAWLNHADWIEIARVSQTLARRSAQPGVVRRAA